MQFYGGARDVGRGSMWHTWTSEFVAICILAHRPTSLQATMLTRGEQSGEKSDQGSCAPSSNQIINHVIF